MHNTYTLFKPRGERWRGRGPSYKALPPCMPCFWHSRSGSRLDSDSGGKTSSEADDDAILDQVSDSSNRCVCAHESEARAMELREAAKLSREWAASLILESFYCEGGKGRPIKTIVEG